MKNSIILTALFIWVLSSPSSIQAARYSCAVPTNYVDLGLPSGTLWAPFNVGATKPSEMGDSFAWGEVTPKKEYKWKNYKWAKIDEFDHVYFSKYDLDDKVDLKNYDELRLDIGDDVAAQKWGDSWAMPTAKQWVELYNFCVFSRDTVDGVAGFTAMGRNGNTLFFPSAGGEADMYWSSDTEAVSYDEYYKYKSRCAIFISNDSVCNVFYDRVFRKRGLAVRPVFNKPVYGETFTISSAKEFLVVESCAHASGVVSVDGVDYRLSNGKFKKKLPCGCHNVELTVTLCGNSFSSGSIRYFHSFVPDVSDAINLGLPSGTLWAPFNVGATNASEPGEHFAMGNLIPVSVDSIRKRVAPDACYWSCEWRTPTAHDWVELKVHCDWKWGVLDGVPGYFVRSKNHKYKDVLFLPAAGQVDGSETKEVGSLGCYWSSPNNSCYAPQDGTGTATVFSRSEIRATDYHPSSLGFAVRLILNTPPKNAWRDSDFRFIRSCKSIYELDKQ